MATAIPFVVGAAGYGPEAQAGATESASSLDLPATTIGAASAMPRARDEIL
ncbi:MAG: hypothetical protein AB7I08_07740 [Thermoleophilia bacterium]